MRIRDHGYYMTNLISKVSVYPFHEDLQSLLFLRQTVGFAHVVQVTFRLCMYTHWHTHTHTHTHTQRERERERTNSAANRGTCWERFCQFFSFRSPTVLYCVNFNGVFAFAALLTLCFSLTLLQLFLFTLVSCWSPVSYTHLTLPTKA